MCCLPGGLLLPGSLASLLADRDVAARPLEEWRARGSAAPPPAGTGTGRTAATGKINDHQSTSFIYVFEKHRLVSRHVNIIKLVI
ncbi:hypothetical protein INR49_007439 [Caranx melampygus]|nr:hypothetical protein INR49_007439 [Caranx melampygus]